jgi:hypothetical protein
VGRTVTPVGKPDAGNQHVRFDERGRKTERTLQGSVTASVLDSTNTRVMVVYFSPRLLCRLDLVVRAISIRRRIASGRPGLSDCFEAQSSIRRSRSGYSRNPTGFPIPVGGRPRPRFFLLSIIDAMAIICYQKIMRAEQEPPLLPSSNPSHGGNPWPRLILFLPQLA